MAQDLPDFALQASGLSEGLHCQLAALVSRLNASGRSFKFIDKLLPTLRTKNSVHAKNLNPLATFVLQAFWSILGREQGWE